MATADRYPTSDLRLISPHSERLIEVVAEASLDGRRSAPLGPARRIREVAAAVEREFVLIPRGEVEDVEFEYALPRELVEDAAAIETVHDMHLSQAIADAHRNGLLVIEMPTRHELPRLQPDPMNMVRFKLTAQARKIAPSGEHAPGPHHPAADGGPGAPS